MLVIPLDGRYRYPDRPSIDVDLDRRAGAADRHLAGFLRG